MCKLSMCVLAHLLHGSHRMLQPPLQSQLLSSAPHHAGELASAVHDTVKQATCAMQGQDRVRQMMEKMGYKAGEGLGARNQGMAAPVAATQHEGRTGLGFATHVAPRYALLPAPHWWHYDGHWEAAEGEEKEYYGYAANPVLVEYGMEVEPPSALPQNVLTSRLLRDEAFIALKKARRDAAAKFAELRQSDNGRCGLCPHHGAPLVWVVLLHCL